MNLFLLLIFIACIVLTIRADDLEVILQHHLHILLSASSLIWPIHKITFVLKINVLEDQILVYLLSTVSNYLINCHSTHNYLEAYAPLLSWLIILWKERVHGQVNTRGHLEPSCPLYSHRMFQRAFKAPYINRFHRK